MKTSNIQGGVPCLCPGRQKQGQAYEMHPHSCTIRDDITYAYAFGDTWMQFNGECATDMGLLYVVRTSSSYSQLSALSSELSDPEHSPTDVASCWHGKGCHWHTVHGAELLCASPQ